MEEGGGVGCEGRCGWAVRGGVGMVICGAVGEGCVVVRWGRRGCGGKMGQEGVWW